MRVQLMAGIAAAVMAGAAAVPFDDRPGGAGEWGFRPEDTEVCVVTPPAFSWRPQKDAVAYELVCSRSSEFVDAAYRSGDLAWTVHCPAEVFAAGTWYWRVRHRLGAATWSEWSRTRSFSIAETAAPMPLPGKADLLARIPRQHPRLFMRPEDLPRLRGLSQGQLAELYAGLVARCDALLAKPPPTEEPRKYPKGMARGSDPWRKIWWGNRRYTRAALDGAATLAFTHLLGGHEPYAEEARRLLLACAAWDPKGATGYRYNDEAGMPYNYYFSRTYTFLHDVLTEEERARCREVMAIRGEEMFRHLYPRHLWRPYSSHSNRAWHFLGEIGIAFHGEVVGADEWVWFAANVFRCVYPVWSDDDGGWHEGTAYWSSYITRFTWWADVMKAALGIDAYAKPYFSKIGTYPMYLQPPGTVGGGFGDLTARRTSGSNRGLMTILAAQAANPHWQWYVDAVGGPASAGGYVGYVRGALPRVTPRAPLDLPTSRCFQGTGQVMMNTDLLEAGNNVSVIMKSSPFGTQSHGYESQNSFLLYAYGERLLIRTGRRDSYGSAHHKKWMWHTGSTNCVTVNGQGQTPHSGSARGAISAFSTSPRYDVAVGEAGPAYGDRLRRFTRRILFIKPQAVVIFDTLEAPEPARFQWLLHAPTRMEIAGQEQIHVVNGKAACDVALMWPPDLAVSQTDQFETPPRPRIQLTEYHLTAETAEPAVKQNVVAVIQPRQAEKPARTPPRLEAADGGFLLSLARDAGGSVQILLRTADTGMVQGRSLSTDGEMAVLERDADGNAVGRFVHGGTRLEAAGP